MRAEVIQEGPLTGVRKGTVTRGFRATLRNRDYEPCWVAGHECGWVEGLDEWHNAFWAADHHVRYDCGRREQPSSGGFASDAMTVDCMPPDPVGETSLRKGGTAVVDGVYVGPYLGAYMQPDPYWVKEYTRRLEEGPIEAAHEGGMQNTPTPSHMGFPPRGAYTEGPTTDLGAITTEVRGFAAGAVPRAIGADRQGHTGWWAGLWGRARA